jgi:tetratricopeptide (TPR) repeat protein
MLGWIAFWFDWDWQMSEDYFKHAIELDPNDTESHLGYAHILSSNHRFQQAVAEVRRARELSPFYMAAAALEAGFLMRAKRPEEALKRLQEAVLIDENFWFTHQMLGAVYGAMGRKEDALAENRLARQLSGGGTWPSANEVGKLVQLGRRAEAETVLAEMLQRSDSQYVPPYDLATAYMGLGDDDTALAWLERAYEAHDPKLVFLKNNNGPWSRVQNRPEFADLLTRMNIVETRK